MNRAHEKANTLMLRFYMRVVFMIISMVAAYEIRLRKMRTAEAGGFFSENFLYLAVFSIPIAYLFYLLARNLIWPYVEANIFPCFEGNGDRCFNGFNRDTFNNG